MYKIFWILKVDLSLISTTNAAVVIYKYRYDLSLFHQIEIELKLRIFAHSTAS